MTFLFITMNNLKKKSFKDWFGEEKKHKHLNSADFGFGSHFSFLTAV